MSGTKLFDRLLEQSTSPFLLETDWESILKICDLIRQGDVSAKYAITQIKKKLSNENIHVVNFSLQCIESMVKNCGSKVHQEIVQKDFLDQMKSLCQIKPDPIKSKVLELIQCWSHAFKKNPNYKLVEDYYTHMKVEGFQFPLLKESEAMFDVEEAPQWVQDSDTQSCFRCRADFGPIRRRHHCRACGQIFCHACSSKQSAIPKFGIEKEVRVCDSCYDKLKSSSSSVPSTPTAGGLKVDPSSIEYFNSQFLKPVDTKSVTPSVQSRPNEKTEQEFEEELQLALALSESEAEAKKQQQQLKLKQSKQKTSISSEDSRSSNASAPYLAEPNAIYSKVVIKEEPKKTESEDQFDESELQINAEIDKFIEDLKKILELYINRMKSDSIRGRSITNDTAVQSLFLQLQHLHPQLLSYIKYKEDVRGYYENLQDKLTQLKDAREALNALRQENYEKKRKEFEEKERLRQMQIAQKLQLMRQQKQSYYLYQQQLNLQRLQEQERNLQMRLNQQRELVLQREFNNTAPQAPQLTTLNYPYAQPGVPAMYTNAAIDLKTQTIDQTTNPIYQQWQQQMQNQYLVQQPGGTVQTAEQSQMVNNYQANFNPMLNYTQPGVSAAVVQPGLQLPVQPALGLQQQVQMPAQPVQMQQYVQPEIQQEKEKPAEAQLISFD